MRGSGKRISTMVSSGLEERMAICGVVGGGVGEEDVPGWLPGVAREFMGRFDGWAGALWDTLWPGSVATAVPWPWARSTGRTGWGIPSQTSQETSRIRLAAMAATRRARLVFGFRSRMNLSPQICNTSDLGTPQ